MRVHYLEIVTPEVEATCASLAAQHGTSFSRPEPALGGARLAQLDGGGRVGVRAPLRDTETPVVRPYRLVDSLDAALDHARAAGAEVAMEATPIAGHGTFAIYILGGIEHGLWQL